MTSEEIWTIISAAEAAGANFSLEVDGNSFYELEIRHANMIGDDIKVALLKREWEEFRKEESESILEEDLDKPIVRLILHDA